MNCPNCGRRLVRVADYPDTGTSVDMYEAECPRCGKKYAVSIELQDGSIHIEELN
ncbi:MAG: hypothetical protein HY670_01285 [Chloroflexi bacterium]|nr:hypothetical protein [Chloroflexota bacterium]